jgi:acyl-CoA thioester hydrolase
MRPRIDIIYRPTLSAKIVFDYEIHDPETEELMASGTSVQVFMDKNYQLVWSSPEFYEKWKQMWGVGEEI